LRPRTADHPCRVEVGCAELPHDTAPPTVKFPGIGIELSRVLHASEAVSAPAPIPPSGTGEAVTSFTDIWDKGKAAVRRRAWTVVSDGDGLRTLVTAPERDDAVALAGVKLVPA
jgi:hypothetical protein